MSITVEDYLDLSAGALPLAALSDLMRRARRTVSSKAVARDIGWLVCRGYGYERASALNPFPSGSMAAAYDEGVISFELEHPLMFDSEDYTDITDAIREPLPRCFTGGSAGTTAPIAVRPSMGSTPWHLSDTRRLHARNIYATLFFAAVCMVAAITLSATADTWEAARYADGDRDKLSALITQMVEPKPLDLPSEEIDLQPPKVKLAARR